MADMTSYADAVREVASSRGEIPSRRGYPGYLYSDLASLYERAGRLQGRGGSLTQVPVLTMPGEDITHPIPDLTGYITEGQVVLSHELHVRGVYPPFDPLRSLSRLMRLGAGEGKTRADHLEIAAQLYALVAEARRVSDLAEVVGADALSDRERGYLGFADAFETGFVDQGRGRAPDARGDARTCMERRLDAPAGRAHDGVGVRACFLLHRRPRRRCGFHRVEQDASGCSAGSTWRGAAQTCSIKSVKRFSANRNVWRNASPKRRPSGSDGPPPRQSGTRGR